MHPLYDPESKKSFKSIISDTVVRQAVETVSSGYNEIVLTGIHLGNYSFVLKHKVKLTEFIETILKQMIIMRIQLSSIEVL